MSEKGDARGRENHRVVRRGVEQESQHGLFVEMLAFRQRALLVCG